MGPTWGPSGANMTQVGPMNFVIWVVRKMGAILSWPPCVNILRPSDAYIHRWFMSSFQGAHHQGEIREIMENVKKISLIWKNHGIPFPGKNHGKVMEIENENLVGSLSFI